MQQSVRLGTLGRNAHQGDRTLRLFQKIDALDAERVELGDPPDVVPYPIRKSILLVDELELAFPLREEWPSGTTVRLVIRDAEPRTADAESSPDTTRLTH